MTFLPPIAETPEEGGEKLICQACPARATYEVFDAEDQSQGFFCKRCGRRKIDRLKELGIYFKQGPTP